MSRDIGLLILRVSAGAMMAFGHGLGKVRMLLSGGGGEFPDPIGLGPLPSLILASGAEFVCALAVLAGVRTRIAAVPVVVTMAVAAFVVHRADPWARQEFALLYLVVFLALAFAGGGRFSVDGLLRRDGRPRRRR